MVLKFKKQFILKYLYEEKYYINKYNPISLSK